MSTADYLASPYINGEFITGRAHEVKVTDKARGSVIGHGASCGAQDATRAIDSAVAAQREWAATSGIERATMLRAFAEHLLGRREEILSLIMRETGGTREKAEDELWAATNQLFNSASQAQDTAGDILNPYKRNKISLSRQVPLGVVSVITPWNYPLSLAMRAVAPALTFGNTVVLKPAGLTPISGGQILAEAVAAAGFPPGVFNVVPGSGAVVGEVLTHDPRVALIHFTGSEDTGRAIAIDAAGRFTRTSMELGGDNAFVVLDDADIETAASCGVWSSLWYQGQTCISAGRHIVMRSVAQAYTDAVVDRVKALRVGDPMTEGVDLGPLISREQLLHIHEDLVLPSISAGARVLTGTDHEALFYQPTVLADVSIEMPIFTEETFGPIIPITVVDSVEEAISVTNRHRQLMSAVFGADPLRSYAVAEQISAGEVHVNDGYLRHGGENQAAGFTSRQWIGIQRSPSSYSPWAERR